MCFSLPRLSILQDGALVCCSFLFSVAVSLYMCRSLSHFLFLYYPFLFFLFLDL